MPNLNRSSLLRGVVPCGLTLLAGLWSAQAFAMRDCTLTFADSIVDFGAMRPSGNEPTLKPSPQRRTYSAVCPEAAQMSLGFRGLAAGASALQFGDKGTYTARVVSARLDGETVQVARLAGVAQPPSEPGSAELALLPADVFAPVNGQQLLKGKRLDVTLEIAPSISVDAVQINQQVNLNSTVQLELTTP
jgi:hypothetical protein